MATYKLGVEVASAHDLMPRDGHGSASACVELKFDGQKFCTSVKDKVLNPVWNEKFYFNISDPFNLPNMYLEASIYNVSKELHTRSFLGKVRIAGTSFVRLSDAVVMHYPLEKRGVISHVKGELGLKVFLTNDPTIKASNPLPARDPRHVPNLKREDRGTFRSIAKNIPQHHNAQHQPPPPISNHAPPPVRYKIWLDPRAASIFVLFCLVAAVALYVTPLQVLVALIGIYVSIKLLS